MYRKTLYLLFFTALAFLFMQGVGGKSPMAIGRYLMAQVGMQASTAPNQFNTLAQQLLEKQKTLEEKEKALGEKETVLAEQASRESKLYLLLGIAVGILLLLILINYYLDWRSRKNEKANSAADITTGKAVDVFRIP